MRFDWLSLGKWRNEVKIHTFVAWPICVQLPKVNNKQFVDFSFICWFLSFDQTTDQLTKDDSERKKCPGFRLDTLNTNYKKAHQIKFIYSH